jgi:predicted DNA-binding protein with PD1-like motif
MPPPARTGGNMKKIKLSDNDWLIRLDVGDEIIASLIRFAGEENVKSGSLTGIGAVGGLKYGYFDINDKEYKVAEESISLEIVNLTGNLARINGEPIVHAHISVGFPDQAIRGGHLVEGYISVTGEIFLRTYDAEVIRAEEDYFGLKLIQ